MEERILKSAKMFFKHQVDIEKFKDETFEKLESVSSVKTNTFILKPGFFLGTALLLISILIGSSTISPTFAEKILVNIPFLAVDNHNVIELEKHPDEVGAYLDLVSSFNKGDIEKYLSSLSKSVSPEVLDKYKGEYLSGVKRKEQLSTKLTLVGSDNKTSVLLSEEAHAFNGSVEYKLQSYIILKNEGGKWKVFEKMPFWKIDDKNQTLLDKSNEIKKQIAEEYKINL